MKQIDCYPFYCMGYECDTEQEAWDTFYSEAEHLFNWIKGVKIWRVAPNLMGGKAFDISPSFRYQVRARVTAFESLPDGWEEAVIRGPYPEPKDPEGMVAFGLDSAPH